MERPKRTYVENPDGYLDEYGIEDAIRDINYNSNKIKQLIQLIHSDYPGFITLPAVTKNAADPSRLSVGEFLAIDSDRNAILFDGDGGISPDDFELDIPYYITIKNELKATDDKRKNPKQNNRDYRYILEENVSVSYSTEPPFTDLCLGTHTITINESGELEAVYDASSRSPVLRSLVDAYSRFSSPEAAAATSSVPIRLDPNGAETIISLSDRNRRFTIWLGNDSIYGLFIFADDGSIRTIQHSSNVNTNETPDASALVDTLYLTSTVNIDETVSLIVKNNFTVAKDVQYTVV
jgi:hypothetical protein